MLTIKRYVRQTKLTREVSYKRYVGFFLHFDIKSTKNLLISIIDPTVAEISVNEI